MAGGTFTISNGGVFGSMMGTPIINLPQTAVLGMHGIKERPVVVDGKIEIRPVNLIRPREVPMEANTISDDVSGFNVRPSSDRWQRVCQIPCCHPEVHPGPSPHATCIGHVKKHRRTEVGAALQQTRGNIITAGMATFEYVAKSYSCWVLSSSKI
jgi:hypothetical protein